MTQFAELTFVQVLSLPAAEAAARTRASSPYPECSADCGQIGVTTHHLPPRTAHRGSQLSFHSILSQSQYCSHLFLSKRKGRRKMAHIKNSNPYTY